MFNLNIIYFYCLLAFDLCKAAIVPQPFNPVPFGTNNTKLSAIEDTESEESNEEGGKIVGGQTTTIEKYPHQVSVLYLGQQICGGSIISACFVLTAAHCTYGSSAYEMEVTYASSYRGIGVVNPVYKIHQNPDYNPITLDYDMSVLEFLIPFKFSAQAQPIRLASAPIADGTRVTITGFGDTKDGQTSPAFQLQVGEIQIIPHVTCEDFYGEGTISPRQLCAGLEEGMVNVCFGDSGGPLTYNNELHGVTSFSDGTCAHAGVPAGFGYVYEMRPFILGVTGVLP